MLTPPVDRPLNALTQDVLTFGSWGLTVAILIWAIRLGMRERSPFYVIVVLAAGVAAFAEPIYDELMMLYFYSNGEMYTHFTAFDIPQPVWTHSGYIVLYASAAVLGCQKFRAGTLTTRAVWGLAAYEFVSSCVFEMIGINGNAYAYWGPHVFRVFDYPLVIGMLEAAQVVVFIFVASYLRDRVRSVMGQMSLFIVFPGTFFLVNAGAGFPMVIALHLQDTNQIIVGIGTVISGIFAVVLVHMMAGVLPHVRRAPVPREQESPVVAQA